MCVLQTIFEYLLKSAYENWSQSLLTTINAKCQCHIYFRNIQFDQELICAKIVAILIQSLHLLNGYILALETKV